MDPRLLLVEADDDTALILCDMLADEGYEVVWRNNLPAAAAALDSDLFGLVLTDTLGAPPADALGLARQVLECARPTPTGLLSGLPVSPAAAADAGFVFLLRKPFDFTVLVGQIAKSLSVPVVDRKTGEAVRAYFECLNRRDWAGLAGLCSGDVEYFVGGDHPFAASVRGREQFRAYAEKTFGFFPTSSFDDLAVYPTPAGVAARYRSRFHSPDGEEMRSAGTVLFRFDGGGIRQIGVRLNDAALRHPGFAPARG